MPRPTKPTAPPPPGRKRLIWSLVALFVLGWAAGGAWVVWNAMQREAEPPSPNGSTPSTANKRKVPAVINGKTLAHLIDERDELDRTLWAPELVAEQHEQVIVQLWDRLREADDPWSVLEALPWSPVVIASYPNAAALPAGVTEAKPAAPLRRLSINAIRGTISRLRTAGHRLDESTWQMTDFHPAGDGPARCVVEVSLHVSNRARTQRWIIRGPLHITWKAFEARGAPVPELIEADGLTLYTRSGPPAFKVIHEKDYPVDPERRVDPLLTYDLDRDGQPELIAAGRNETLRYQNGKFNSSTFGPVLPTIANPAIIADFDGDRLPDFLTIGVRRNKLKLMLVPVRSQGSFAESAQDVAAVNFERALSATPGDIDGDGDLDLWVNQNREPYIKGKMPTPLHDARDGFPGYLLTNDGKGRFTDATEKSGLEAKRSRRSCASVFADMNGDGHLDLAIASEYAGLDLFLGNGQGEFRDVTDELIPARYGFGFTLTPADFNRDGKLDLFFGAIDFPVARRLDALGLSRPDRPDIAGFRGAMSAGSRMHLSSKEGFAKPPAADTFARAGWPWASCDLDVDNNGLPDVFVSNGRLSGKSARDYASVLWRHDLATGGGTESSAVALIFDRSRLPHVSGAESYSGWQTKSLFMNAGARGWVDVAYLLGVSFQVDGRQTVADDWNGDGRIDLAFIDRSSRPDEPNRFRLRVLQNELQTPGHWIGVRLYEGQAGRSPWGATVKLTTSRGTRVAAITTGGSIGCQGAAMAHFGLGPETRVDSIEVRWPDGEQEQLTRPAIDRWHYIGK